MLAQPGSRKLYTALRRNFYLLALLIAHYSIMRRCTNWGRERVLVCRHAKILTLFLARALLECVAVDILAEFLQKSRGHNYLLLITDTSSKLVWTVLLKKITTHSVAEGFIRHWVLIYAPSVNIFSDNGIKYVARYFQDVCRILDKKNLCRTTY